MDEATPAVTTPPPACLGTDWFDPLEEAVRGQVRAFIERLLEEELEAALGRGRYERGMAAKGHRNGHRERRLDTTFGPLVLAVPRARLADDDAGEREWKSELLPAYRRLSRRAELLIAEVYLAGVNTRRVRRALQTLFAGRISKDAVSRAWHRTKSAWEAWQKRDLAGDDIVRLILDGTVVKVRLDRKATAISLLIVLGVRRDGQKVVLAIKNMGGETEAAWRAVLDDLLARGLAKPELVIVDGGKGLEAALASLWDDVPIQRCWVHSVPRGHTRCQERRVWSHDLTGAMSVSLPPPAGESPVRVIAREPGSRLPASGGNARRRSAASKAPWGEQRTGPQHDANSAAS